MQNQLVAVLDTSGQPIVGTVNADGLSATFAGVSHFSMVVALEPPAAVPVITPLLSGTLGANGWYTSNVSLSWSIVSSTAVSSRTGCDPRTVSVNTGSAGLTYTCTATNAVGTSSGSATIRKDATAPVSVALPSPLPNLAGWWKSPVTVTFSGVDLQSGIASCTTPVVLSLEGAGQGASGQCTNNAGLASALAALSGIRIDLTAPGISITAAGEWRGVQAQCHGEGQLCLHGCALRYRNLPGHGTQWIQDQHQYAGDQDVQGDGRG